MTEHCDLGKLPSTQQWDYSIRRPVCSDNVCDCPLSGFKESTRETQRDIASMSYADDYQDRNEE